MGKWKEVGSLKRMCLVGLFVLSLPGLPSGKNLLTTSPSGNIASRRPTVTVYVHIDRNPQNRHLDVIAESPEGYWSASSFDLDGEAAPLSFSVDLRALLPGSYTITATLTSVDGKGKWHDTVIKQRDPLEVL